MNFEQPPSPSAEKKGLTPEDQTEKRTQEIYQKRLEGKEPGYTWVEIDKMLQEKGITPGSEEAKSFMERWDWEQAEKQSEKKEQLLVDVAGEKLEKALNKIGEVLGKGAEKLPQKQERAVEDAVWKSFDAIGNIIVKAGEKLPQQQTKVVEDAVWKTFDKMGDFTAKGVVWAERGVRKGVKELARIEKLPNLKLAVEKLREKWQEKIEKTESKDKRKQLKTSYSWRERIIGKLLRKEKQKNRAELTGGLGG